MNAATISATSAKNAPSGRAASVRVDLQHVAGMVAEKSRVLDIGCGDGALLDLLKRARDVDARGMELSQAGVNACVALGLSVVQGDADFDLKDYPSDAFDYAILSQTLQATRDPRRVLSELVRIGRHAIVSFPNFGHWRVRWQLLSRGRMPVTDALREPWHATPNIHLCTILDFLELARSLGIIVERVIPLDDAGRRIPFERSSGLANLLAEQAVFLLRRGT
jgi:methionine biosynthesis protein MetW